MAEDEAGQADAEMPDAEMPDAEMQGGAGDEGQDEGERLPTDAREALLDLIRAQGAAPPDEPPGPTDWRAIGPEDAAEAWDELREWVEELVRRYPHLDHHVIPNCWARHNEHVEALVALRDYERLAFFASSPASSPYNYQVALGQIETRLREWTARAGCLGEHREASSTLRPPSDAEWRAFVDSDVAERGLQAGLSSPGEMDIDNPFGV